MRTSTLSVLLLFLLPGATRTLADDPKPVGVGDQAPDFGLTNQADETVKLSSLQGKKNVVLAFTRAHWWPYYSKQLVQLQSHYEALQKLEAEILMVNREEQDGVEGLKKQAAATKAAFPLLLDLNKAQTARYSTEGLATYLIDQDGKVVKMLTGAKTARPSGDASLEAARATFGGAEVSRES